jgi:hypothetical protein
MRMFTNFAPHCRHPELVSGSMPRSARTVGIEAVDSEAWMLKQVQHDGLGESA